MDKMLQWTLQLGQNVTVDVVNLDVTSRQPNCSVTWNKASYKLFTKWKRINFSIIFYISGAEEIYPSGEYKIQFSFCDSETKIHLLGESGGVVGGGWGGGLTQTQHLSKRFPQ